MYSKRLLVFTIMFIVSALVVDMSFDGESYCNCIFSTCCAFHF